MFSRPEIKKLIVSLKCLWLSGAFVIVLFSCKNKAETKSEYSDQFQTVFDNYTKLSEQKKYNGAISYLDSAFAAIKNPTAEDHFRFYGLQFIYHRKVTHNLKKESAYADSMMQMAKKNINSSLYAGNYAEANFALGDAYFDRKQFNAAYQCFYQGYVMGKNTLKFDILAEYTYRMGMVMFQQAHYNEAANYFKESYRHGSFYKKNFRTFYQRQEVLNDVGESYLYAGNTDSASVYFDRALAYINQNDGKYKVRAALIDVARAVVYADQGEVARLKGEYEPARQLLQKSIAINSQKGNDNYNAELAAVNLGKLYFDNGKLPEFIALSQNLRKQLDSVKNEEAETDWNKLMSAYYATKNNPAKALAYLSRYNLLKDSITKKSDHLKEIDVVQQLANYDKQYQISSLKDNNRQQQIYTYMAATCAVMALVIIGLVHRNWKKSKRDLQVFSTLNRQVSKQKNELEITLAELNKNGQEKDRILRAVAHDLRNPIGGIASLTLAMADDDFTDEQKELINLIKETSNDSLELINEILEVTGDNGLAEVVKEPVEINSLLTKSVGLLRFKAAEKSQEIKLELLAKPEELLISREKIWRVMSNLISNAIKFSPYGGTIFVKIEAIGNEIQIAVIDAGIGIPDNIKNKVFNMFTEAKRPGTAGEKSFGLGLSISRQIIENHNGKIWFESSSKGTTFFVRLNRLVTTKTKLSKNQHTTSPTI